MNAEKKTKLQIINTEPNYQKRLKLLVDNDFIWDANQLIRKLAQTNTVMFHYEWHERELCRPLARVTDGTPGVYVIITSSDKLEYGHSDSERKEGDFNVIFELEWAQKFLGWNEDQVVQFVRDVSAHALSRPLNQWSFNQAEGTSRASRRWMSFSNPTAREVAALHLVYQLRKANFGHICNYLGCIEGFPFPNGDLSKQTDLEKMVQWIADQLIELGWSPNRICKEFVEWIWLKKDTHPQWLLAVAKACAYDSGAEIYDGSCSRSIAVRHWLRHRLDFLIDCVSKPRNADEVTEVYRQLFQIGQLGSFDKDWIEVLLVSKMASGKVRAAYYFCKQFGNEFGIESIDILLVRAMNKAASAGDYAIAVALAKRGGLKFDSEWETIVSIRKLTAELE